MSCNYFSGNNIYGDELRETLLKLQEAGSEEDAAYILMQRIFPATSPAILVRDGNWDKGHVISEAGVFGTYLRYIAWLHICHSYMLKFSIPLTSMNWNLQE